MGSRVFVGREDGGEGAEKAHLYDSVTGWSFGPFFASAEDANDFLEWVEDRGGPDPRQLSDPNLEAAVRQWREERS